MGISCKIPSGPGLVSRREEEPIEVGVPCPPERSFLQHREPNHERGKILTEQVGRAPEMLKGRGREVTEYSW